ncbi:hypothetical protein C8R45DRAFT_1072636 [Mycena sanguinolenta]|nr:hypothetical protein C8R45DRAFT_1072636 [Mycena sanguinolenta]
MSPRSKEEMEEKAKQAKLDKTKFSTHGVNCSENLNMNEIEVGAPSKKKCMQGKLSQPQRECKHKLQRYSKPREQMKQLHVKMLRGSVAIQTERSEIQKTEWVEDGPSRVGIVHRILRLMSTKSNFSQDRRSHLKGNARRIKGNPSQQQKTQRYNGDATRLTSQSTTPKRQRASEGEENEIQNLSATHLIFIFILGGAERQKVGAVKIQERERRKAPDRRANESSPANPNPTNERTPPSPPSPPSPLAALWDEAGRKRLAGRKTGAREKEDGKCLSWGLVLDIGLVWRTGMCAVSVSAGDLPG